MKVGRKLAIHYHAEEKRNPYYSSIVNFGIACKGRNFVQAEIAYWFDKLVDKDDYAKEDTEALHLWLSKLSKA